MGEVRDEALLVDDRDHGGHGRCREAPRPRSPASLQRCGRRWRRGVESAAGSRSGEDTPPSPWRPAPDVLGCIHLLGLACRTLAEADTRSAHPRPSAGWRECPSRQDGFGSCIPVARVPVVAVVRGWGWSSPCPSATRPHLHRVPRLNRRARFPHRACRKSRPLGRSGSSPGTRGRFRLDCGTAAPRRPRVTGKDHA